MEASFFDLFESVSDRTGSLTMSYKGHVQKVKSGDGDSVDFGLEVEINGRSRSVL